jgi:hypothetical protein
MMGSVGEELWKTANYSIIEGPPPVFERIDVGWPLGLNEAPAYYSMALTKVANF